MDKPDFEKLANNRYGYSPDVVDDMSHYIDGMEKIWNSYVTPLQSRIAELEKENQWISVKERLPEPNTKVLCDTGAAWDNVCVLYYRSDGKFIDNDVRNDDSTDWYDATEAVKHWFPFPSPPKDTTCQ